MPPRSQAFHHEGRRLRDLAARPDVLVLFTMHAEQRMRERDVSRIDVQSILRRGAVVELQEAGKWLVEGRDMDGRTIRAVVAPDEEEGEIVVVTVIG